MTSLLIFVEKPFQEFPLCESSLEILSILQHSNGWRKTTALFSINVFVYLSSAKNCPTQWCTISIAEGMALTLISRVNTKVCRSLFLPHRYPQTKDGDLDLYCIKLVFNVSLIQYKAPEGIIVFSYSKYGYNFQEADHVSCIFISFQFNEAVLCWSSIEVQYSRQSAWKGTVIIIQNS